MANSFSGSPNTQRQNGSNLFHQNVRESRAAHLARVRVDAVRLQHLSLLEEVELRRFWSLTSEKEEPIVQSHKLEIVLSIFKHKIIRMLSVRS